MESLYKYRLTDVGVQTSLIRELRFFKLGRQARSLSFRVEDGVELWVKRIQQDLLQLYKTEDQIFFGTEPISMRVTVRI